MAKYVSGISKLQEIQDNQTPRKKVRAPKLLKIPLRKLGLSPRQLGISTRQIAIASNNGTLAHTLRSAARLLDTKADAVDKS